MTKQQFQSQTLRNRETVREKIRTRIRGLGLWGAIRHYRVVLAHRAHTIVETLLGKDRKDTVRATGKVEPADVQGAGPNIEFGLESLASPWVVLDWVVECLPDEKEDWSFVDLGAGEGRAMLAAAKHPYRHIVGVEYVAELADAARRNIRAAGWLQSKSITVLHCDASDYELPQGPVVVFLFNPFERPVIDNVVDAIAQSYARSPRPIVVAYLNPKYSNVFAGLHGFSRQALGPIMALKFSTLSPYKLHLYANREGSALLHRCGNAS